MEVKSGLQNRIRMLHILDLLRRETDEEHPMSATEISKCLEVKGIPCERKAVYRDIEALTEFGYDILSTRRPKQGVFLASRELEAPEVRLLLDAVASAPFITEKKTRELTEKLCGFLSEAQGESAAAQIFSNQGEHRIKFENEEVYYTIDALHRAIALQKKVSFQYYHRVIQDGKVQLAPGREFTISPYALVWNEDKYYLVGNYDKYDNLSHYRIDRMRHVSVTEEDARSCREVSCYQDQFDSADYRKRSFFMFGGEEVTVRLSCVESLLEAMVDKFGELRILEQADGRFVFEATVRCGEGFLDWILRWGGQAVVLSPQSVREQVAKKIRTLADSYEISLLGEK